jgi:D-tyrosyl-tRNA(Tyr) deacylase
MRAVVQRVNRARVVADGRVTGEISEGVVVLLGVGRGDTPESAAYLAEKIAHLRIFDDERAKMNRSLLEAGGAALVVPSSHCMATSAKAAGPVSTKLRPPRTPDASTRSLSDACVGKACALKQASSRHAWPLN